MVHGLYWHEFATPQRTLEVVVGVVGRERRVRTEIELRQGQSLLLHPHSVCIRLHILTSYA